MRAPLFVPRRAGLIRHRRESCAIIKYLVDKYDTGNAISATTLEDKAKELQWLFFAVSVLCDLGGVVD